MRESLREADEAQVQIEADARSSDAWKPMNRKDRITRRSMLKNAVVGASSVAAGVLAPTDGLAESKAAAGQVPVELRSSDYPR
jgi:hypothetical protein